MCGIAGWIDFGQDLRQQRDTALAMTRTMSCRGPDDEGLYLTEHAALGHRRLAVIDVEHGEQPMAVDQETGRRREGRDSEGDLAIVYSGEVYNFTELRSEVDRDLLVTKSDTEVVLHMHRRFGPGAVEQMNGMFAYAIWDEREQALFLVRDRLGIKPLYYYPTGSGVMFGSEPKAILANPLVRPVVDEDGLRRLLGFVATPGTTPYAGMQEVRPGHVVRIDRNGVHDTAYWTLESHEHTDDLETTIDTVRDLLLDTADRQLVADVPLCTLLSGGLDSSALTAMAARRLAADGKGAVRSFSVDFEGYEEGFVADDIRGTPDSPYVVDVAKHVASDHTDIVLDNAKLLDPEALDAVLKARDVPSFGEIDTSLYLLFQAVRRESTVALSGESADEVFGGYIDFHDPVAVNSGSFPWLHGKMISMMGDADSLINAPMLEQLDLAGHTAAEYDTAIGEVGRISGESAEEARMREVCYLYLTRFLPNLLDRKDRMSMAVGLEVRVPFCDHRLVEYVFNTPWAMKTFDGREKSLLRAATKDLLPTSVVDRVKSPYPSTQDPGYLVATSKELLQRAEAPDSVLREITDLEAVRAVAENPKPEHKGFVDRMNSFDKWVREYGIDLQV